MTQIFIGLLTEGTTDARFLEPIIEKTFVEIGFACKGTIDIAIFELSKQKKLNFTEQVLAASKEGFENYGITVLCVQADADNKKLEDTYKNKIQPTIEELEKQNNEEFCKIIVPIVPIQETEAWLLADTQLLKNEIGTKKTDQELGINKFPENIANPKEVIENAIRIACQDMTKRRRNELSISELYLPVGNKIEIEKLEKLPSFQNFKENVKNAFRQIGLL